MPAVADTTRQIVVAVGAAVAIAGAAWGSGAFGGTPIEEAADGALAADATLLAPASTAFAIWSVISAGLALFAVVQALPSRADVPRYRAISWWVLASMLLNAVWIGVVQADLLWLSPLVLASLVLVLAKVAITLVATPAHNGLDVAATDVTLGLYLGWSTVATAANLAALAVGSTDATADAGMPWTAIAAGALGVIAIIAARYLRERPGLAIGMGLAMAWGLAWIAVGRATDSPESLGMMWAAGLAAVVSFAAPFAAIDFDPARRVASPAPEADPAERVD
ncbi:tryptophan-rich sensory protein [Demequina globuliformis]|uniref:tryptophan-rich sensory protein n=1 Tax=Demequina globuliformis TaxID=676202 RepID=UPI000A6BA00B|nr:tryptophan-rich sensory protein [Demequina globuliformis]